MNAFRGSKDVPATDHPTVDLTTATFFSTVKRDGIVLVDWWASRCGPCRAFAPVYGKVAGRHPDIVFGKVDTEAEGALGAAFQIRSIPTLMAFRGGILLFAQLGMLPERALEDLIERVRALDMNEVRQKVEACRASGGEEAKQEPRGALNVPDSNAEVLS